MSKLPLSRLLEELPARRAKLANFSNKGDTSSKNTLSDSDKENIGGVLKATRDKIVELIALLDSYDKTPDGEEERFYGRSQGQLNKIRPLKNEVAGSYFAVGEALRTHGLGSEKIIQDYYAKIKSFKQNYHATTLKSKDVRNFHQQILELIGGILEKALKSN